MSIEELLKEDEKRVHIIRAPFDPIKGINSPVERKKVHIDDMYPYDMYLPKAMLKNKLVKAIIKAGTIKDFCTQRYSDETYTKELREKVVREFTRVRCKHDFSFAAYFAFEIKNKEGGRNIHFKLSYPQRYMVGILEELRLAGIPIRIILLKARQWGGSTLVQLYIAWIQLFWKEAWYSVIVAQDATTSRKIKAMYSKMLKALPPWLIRAPDNAELAFTPYEGSQLDSIITYNKGNNIARDTVITVGTYNNPNAGRGGDMSCVHYSEVGLWEDTDGKTPEDIIRSISSSLLMAPLTVEVIESTANGMSNFYYRAYQAAKEGRSNRKAVFVPWFKIERYTKPVQDRKAFASWLLENKDNPNPPVGCLDSGQYYWHLWVLGATMEAINWYIEKRKDFLDHEDMMAEFPSDDVEAFKNSGDNVFNIYDIDRMKGKCKNPNQIGELYGEAADGEKALVNIEFKPDVKGGLKVWSMPDIKQKISDRYLVVVDIGGRSKKADYSDILVIDRYWLMYGGNEEIVAEWHGHIDHHLLAWKAAQISKFYNNALLVIESNTIETKDNADGDTSGYIFNLLADCHVNLYVRKVSEEKIQKGITGAYGYHTNHKTKPIIISNLQTYLSKDMYIERNLDALSEFAVYTKVGAGKYEAAEGYHDDMVMVRAIGLYISRFEMDIPAIIQDKPKQFRKTRKLTEATII